MTTYSQLPEKIIQINGGIRTDIWYKYDDDHKIIKCIKKSKIKTQKKTVLKRKFIKKFGEAINDKPMKNIINKEVYFNFVKNFESKEEKYDEVVEKLSKRLKQIWDSPSISKAKTTKTTKTSNLDGIKNKYVPRYIRNRSENNGKDPTIIVRNIPEYCSYFDMKALFKNLNPVNVGLPKNYNIPEYNRGFAFVTFASINDQTNAIKLLNGHKYGACILSADIAN